jgi:hypothetical protein
MTGNVACLGGPKDLPSATVNFDGNSLKGTATLNLKVKQTSVSTQACLRSRQTACPDIKGPAVFAFDDV